MYTHIATKIHTYDYSDTHIHKHCRVHTHISPKRHTHISMCRHAHRISQTDGVIMFSLSFQRHVLILKYTETHYIRKGSECVCVCVCVRVWCAGGGFVWLGLRGGIVAPGYSRM